MRTKFIIASIFFIGIFSLFSCDEAINKDKKQENNQEQENSEADTLVIYELSLHQMYLQIEEKGLKSKIDTLDEETQAYLVAKTALDSIRGNLLEIEQLMENSAPKQLTDLNGDKILLGSIGPIGSTKPKPKPKPKGPKEPIPVPEPLPCNCRIPLSGLTVVVPDELPGFDMLIKNSQNETVGKLSTTPEKLYSKQNDMGFKGFQLETPKNLSGQVTIEVTKHSKITEGTLTYRFSVDLPKI